LGRRGRRWAVCLVDLRYSGLRRVIGQAGGQMELDSSFDFIKSKRTSLTWQVGRYRHTHRATHKGALGLLCRVCEEVLVCVHYTYTYDTLAKVGDNRLFEIFTGQFQPRTVPRDQPLTIISGAHNGDDTCVLSARMERGA
jgi:hypothetical protein